MVECMELGKEAWEPFAHHVVPGERAVCTENKALYSQCTFGTVLHKLNL